MAARNLSTEFIIDCRSESSNYELGRLDKTWRRRVCDILNSKLLEALENTDLCVTYLLIVILIL